MPGRLAMAICLAASILVFDLQPALAQESDVAMPLTSARLPSLLIEQGYDPLDLGSGAYEVTAGPPGAECRISVSLGQDEALIWLFAYFGELVAPNALTIEGLLALLTANEVYGPAYFSVADGSDEQRWLYMNQTLANNGISPAQLANGIEDFCVTVGAVIRSWADQPTP